LDSCKFSSVQHEEVPADRNRAGLAAIARNYLIKRMLDSKDFERDWMPLAVWYVSSSPC